MRHWNTCAVFVCALLGTAGLTEGADKAQQDYEKEFANEEARVVRTRSPVDDLAFARKLIRSSRWDFRSSESKILLCEKACQIAARHPLHGWAIVVDALDQLKEAAPDQELECLAKSLKMYEDLLRRSRKTESRAGASAFVLRSLVSLADAEMAQGKAAEAGVHYRRAAGIAAQLRWPQAAEIACKAKKASETNKLNQTIAALERALARNPKHETAASKLLMLYLVERDDPMRAAKWLEAAGQEQVLKTCLPLAVRPTSEVAEAACLDLGRWYESLAGEASSMARPRMLSRAKTYYNRYLAQNGREDASSAEVNARLKEIETQCAASGASRVPTRLSREMLAWIQQRDALPVRERTEVLRKKLIKTSKTGELTEFIHAIEDGRIVRLNLHDNKGLTTVAPLRGMGLKHLNVERTSVMRLDDLEGMPLEFLAVGGTRVGDLRPLKGMGLKELRAGGCPLRSLDGIEGMPLQILGIRGVPIASLGRLRGMRMRKLWLGSGVLATLEGIEGVPLENLELHCKRIRDLSPLAGMPLTELDLKGCTSLRSLEPIMGMPLQRIHLGETKFATPAVAGSLRKQIPTLREVLLK